MSNQILGLLGVNSSKLKKTGCTILYRTASHQGRCVWMEHVSSLVSRQRFRQYGTCTTSKNEKELKVAQ